MTVARWQKAVASATAAILAFAATWVVLMATGGSQPLRPTELSRASEGDVKALEADRYLQEVRETGDIALYDKARDSLRGVRGSAAAETARGTLALAHHDFRGGLRHGREALRLAPDSVRPYSLIVDAQVELGRYADARRSLQRMIDLKPNLAAYARVSYFRELHGDTRGALEAMRLAASTSGGSRENVAYVQSLVGQLEFERGHLDAAERAYRAVLARVNDHAGALQGLARIDAARGQVDLAVRRQEPLAADPNAAPEAVIALGELQLAAGQRGAGERTMQKARAKLRAEAMRGVGNANERALVEADHGDPMAAIRLGRRGYEHAPSIVSADALAWAYTRAGRPRTGLAWARRALGTGSRDRLLLYHAGIAARDAGEPALARRWLRRSVAGNPRFSPLHGPRAERALAGLR